jgi:TRAP-type C4-dicarboxylate transport system permease small subunit
MNNLDRMLRLPIDAAAIVAGVAIVVMMLHVVADVTGRYLFGTPISGTTEIVSGYYMVAAVFLPLAYVARTEGHIMVELFTRRMRPRPLAALESVVCLIGIAYMGVFTWRTGAEAVRRHSGREMWETADGLLVIWPSRWLLPIGAGLLTLYLVLRLVRNLREVASGKQS